jgi:hypothetical protein
MTELEFIEATNSFLCEKGNGTEYIVPHNEIGIRDDAKTILKIIELVNLFYVDMYTPLLVTTKNEYNPYNDDVKHFIHVNKDALCDNICLDSLFNKVRLCCREVVKED